MISTNDLHWAAGFLEGEGTFGLWSRCLRVQASQVQLEPLERLQSLFGGAIYNQNTPAGNKQQCYQWAATGKCAAGVLMTLFSLMSTRRKDQIKTALSRWAAIPTHPRILKACHGNIS